MHTFTRRATRPDPANRRNRESNRTRGPSTFAGEKDAAVFHAIARKTNFISDTSGRRHGNVIVVNTAIRYVELW